MENFTKVVRIGTAKDYGYTPYSVFCKIKYVDGRLSITGVEGPTQDGNARGSCGQISKPENWLVLADGWTMERINEFWGIWNRWHLNDMRAGSKVQEDYLRANPVSYKYPESHYEVASRALADAGLNPDTDGYKYGHARKTEEVPTEVLEFLKSLPDADRTPAWV